MKIFINESYRSSEDSCEDDSADHSAPCCEPESSMSLEHTHLDRIQATAHIQNCDLQ